MPTRKISEHTREAVCESPEHIPSNMRVFSPGIWEHECPACGHKQRFIVKESSLRSRMKPYDPNWGG